VARSVPEGSYYRFFLPTAHNLRGYFFEPGFFFWESIGAVLIFFALQGVDRMKLGFFLAGNLNSFSQEMVGK
jgi:hypothetical protein